MWLFLGGPSVILYKSVHILLLLIFAPIQVVFYIGTHVSVKGTTCIDVKKINKTILINEFTFIILQVIHPQPV